MMPRNLPAGTSLNQSIFTFLNTAAAGSDSRAPSLCLSRASTRSLNSCVESVSDCDEPPAARDGPEIALAPNSAMLRAAVEHVRTMSDRRTARLHAGWYARLVAPRHGR